MYTHTVHYTKNMLDGPLQGLQIEAAIRTTSAIEAAKYSSDLNVGGIHTDALTRAPWTAHNINITSTEDELVDLIQPVDFRPLEDAELDDMLRFMDSRGWL